MSTPGLPAEAALPDPRPGQAEALRIRLEGFEGPLDVLLHLIRQHELDILDIPIAFITREYLAFIDGIDALDLDLAGAYLVMAAHLLWLKSRVLLPRPPAIEDEPEDDEQDPREELVRRLLQYQRYRAAADALDRRTIQGRDVFIRPAQADRIRAAAGPGALVPLTLFDLLETFRALLARVNRPEVLHEITRERLSLRQTVNRVASFLEHTPRTTLLELVQLDRPRASRQDVVITFLALLEMARLKLVRLFQSRLAAHELHVERAVLREGELEQRLSGLIEDDTDDAEPLDPDSPENTP